MWQWSWRVVSVAALVAAAGFVLGAVSTTLAGSSRSGGYRYGWSGDRFVDLDWLTPKRGWALVDRACGSSSSHCLAVYGTRNGGRSWSRLTPINAFGCTRASTCISGIRFLTSRIGYLYGLRSFATANGGRTWAPRRRRLVESVAVSGGLVFQLVYSHAGCPGPCRPALVVLSPQLLGVRTIRRWPDAPGFGDQLVAGGSNLYVIFYGHRAGGAGSAHARIAVSHDRGRTWAMRGDPCGGSALHEKDASAIAAAGQFVSVLCLPRTGEGPAFTALSPNAGKSFTAGATLHLSAPEQIAVSDHGAIAVGNGGTAGAGEFDYQLALSRDRGSNWRVVIRDREPLAETLERGPLRFVAARDLSWVGSPYFVWQSSDAGRTWRKRATP